MSWWNEYFYGVRGFIWFYFFVSILLGIVVIIFFYKELIKKQYYVIRFPEKVIKVIIHYPSNMYKEYWRLIPDNDRFDIEKKQYQYDGKEIKKGEEFFTKTDAKNKKSIIKIGNKEYILEDEYKIKYRWRKYPEIHYFFNNPRPIIYDLSNKKVDLSSKQLEEFKENDLFAKLLRLDQERNLLSALLILCIINAIVSAVVLAKLMGWLK